MEEQANETINMDFPNVPTPESRSATPIPPALPPRADKRILLLVYIHGFKGNETSFRELPMVRPHKNEANEGLARTLTTEAVPTYVVYAHFPKVQDKTGVLNCHREFL